ncbi:22101_t:CDS:2, partial [Dentiscutata erythropus]
ISHEERVILTKIAYKNHLFQVTNVYAPPNSKDRSEFFERWTPLYDEESINILGEDFNTNINPETIEEQPFSDFLSKHMEQPNYSN